MKRTLLLLSIIGFSTTLLMTPRSSEALSCLAPADMIPYIVEESNYVVVTASAGDTKEYTQSKADPLDPNAQFDSGYTGQFLTVSDVHKGSIDSQLWVYFEKNGTWGYLCAGEPPAAGTEVVYIINQGNGTFALPQVVNTYAVDSDLAEQLFTALAADEESGEPYRNEASKADWQDRLRNEITEMIFLVRIKLDAWRFWMNQ